MTTPTALLTLVLAASPAKPESPPSQAPAIAGPAYGASGLHRFLLGNGYRDLWTAKVTTELLDLDAFAGGLTPVRRVGGQQTRGLALKGADGLAYTFRSVDKDPSDVLPSELHGTFAHRLVNDQIAASHPAAALVAAELLEAAGVLHTTPRLVVMPDDVRLGQFRATFAGLIGTIELYPQPGFAGATEILNAAELADRMAAGPDTQVDARAYLRARLVDLFLGDWDRHRKQWRWARLPGHEGLKPIPEDRDQAFARYEGLALGIARNAYPQLVRFGPRYSRMEGLTWNGREQDRRLLNGLAFQDWTDIAAELKAALTDGVIDTAVGHLPAPYYERDGGRLAAALKARRDSLPEAARRFYRHLAREVDLHGTDAAETATVRRAADGNVEVELGPTGASPTITRRLYPHETAEVRLYLHGGDDRTVVHGCCSPITVRVIGGDGADALDDSAGGGTRFYDDPATSGLTPGRGTMVDGRPDPSPLPDPDSPWIPARDWGSRSGALPWLKVSPGLGAFFGAALETRRFGFREHPYATRQRLRMGYATAAQTGRVEYEVDLRRTSSQLHTTLRARASGIEILGFHGFGNETVSEGTTDFYRVLQRQFGLEPMLTMPVGPRASLTLGARALWSNTDHDDDRLISRLRPYGSDSFGQIGATAQFDVDTRKSAEHNQGGLRLRMGGSIYPRLWDVRETFGEAHGETAAYLPLGGKLEPVLAVRIGAKRVWGDYPFHEAAFVGGGETLRGFLPQRFAGDAAAWAGAEMRVFLTRAFVLVPADLGILFLADSGRVFLAGEDSDRWHSAWGGGVWLSVLGRANTLSLAVAKSRETTTFHLNAGFRF